MRCSGAGVESDGGDVRNAGVGARIGDRKQ